MNKSLITKIVLSLAVLGGLLGVSALHYKKASQTPQEVPKPSAFKTANYKKNNGNLKKLTLGNTEMQVRQSYSSYPVKITKSRLESDASARRWMKIDTKDSIPTELSHGRKMQRASYLTPDQKIIVYLFSSQPGDPGTYIDRSEIDLKDLLEKSKGGSNGYVRGCANVEVPRRLRNIVVGKPVVKLENNDSSGSLIFVCKTGFNVKQAGDKLKKKLAVDMWDLEPWSMELSDKNLFGENTLLVASKGKTICHIMAGKEPDGTFVSYRFSEIME
jgi:hypothetical protein